MRAVSGEQPRREVLAEKRRDGLLAAVALAVYTNGFSFLRKLFDWVRPGRSDVMVFYSGHGVPGARDKRGYLLPVDADAQTPELNVYPVDVLYEILA